MVNLTRIYTRTGDAGETRLGDMSLTTKNDLRLHAYADVDEANAQIGLALATGGLEDDVVTVLTTIQNDLFDVGADFCTPVVDNPEFPPLRIEQAYIDRLEGWCDHYNDDLPSLRSFILNGGTPGGALLHVARTVARRAERAGWAAFAEHAEHDERARDQVPQPALGPAVHPRPARQPRAAATCCGCPAGKGEPAPHQTCRYRRRHGSRRQPTRCASAWSGQPARLRPDGCAGRAEPPRARPGSRSGRRGSSRPRADRSASGS